MQFLSNTRSSELDVEEIFYYYMNDDNKDKDGDDNDINNTIADSDFTQTTPSSLSEQQEETKEPMLVHLNNNETMKCFPWKGEEADEWWEHKPTWEVSIENDDYFCFTPMTDVEKASFFQRAYDHQYNMTNPNCSDTGTYTKKMISSGWAADIANVASGLVYGMETNRPFQIKQHVGHWHYTFPKIGKRTNMKPVCPNGDFFCYFLPISSCPAQETIDPISTRAKGKYIKWATEYVTRQKQWIRKEVYDYLKQKAPEVTTPCVALHVRRADVVLHSKKSRKYFPISSYINLLNDYEQSHDSKSNSNNNDGKESKVKENVQVKNGNATRCTNATTRNILLFTDDQNAIEEAKEFYPTYNWMYLNKTRHRGSSGGFENQLPSGSPKEEVIALLAIFQLAQKCNILVHTQSGFAFSIYDSMVRTGRDVVRLQVDSDFRGRFHLNNTNSELELKSKLDEIRNMKVNTTCK